MKERFITLRLTAQRRLMLGVINNIIEDYRQQGYRLTLRQLYYQLVTKNIIENKERSYKNLGSLVSDGRLMGVIDWDAIEDRVRVPKACVDFSDIRDLVDWALRVFRLRRWDGQSKYVELWVEKDALAGVLWPIAARFHVTLMVNRGYSSQSAMYDASKRFIRASCSGKECHLIYLGDHDPSGEDMVRDIGDRLEMLRATVDVKKVALTMDQVRQYNPPPNPAKMSDSRAGKYVAEHGEHSWEVDALPPQVLNELITSELAALVDQSMVDEIIAREEIAKNKLRNAAKRIKA